MAAGALALAIPLAGAGGVPTAAIPDFAAYARLAGFSNLVEIRSSGKKRRVEVATDALVQTFIEDREKGVLTVLTGSSGRRLAYQFPLPDNGPPVPMPMDSRQMAMAQRLQKIGADNVSNIPCALYRYAGYLGGSGEVCVSREGVVLRLRPDGRKEPVYQIERLVFRKQDPNYFVTPMDYTRAALPGMGGVGFGKAVKPVPGSLGGAGDAPPLAADEARITVMDSPPSTASSGVMRDIP
jgi:hypothetical protein